LVSMGVTKCVGTRTWTFATWRLARVVRDNHYRTVWLCCTIGGLLPEIDLSLPTTRHELHPLCWIWTPPMEFPSLIHTTSGLTKLGRDPYGPRVPLQKCVLSFGVVLPEVLVISILPCWVSCISIISVLLTVKFNLRILVSFPILKLWPVVESRSVVNNLRMVNREIWIPNPRNSSNPNCCQPL
jgi:hypothetical protein